MVPIQNKMSIPLLEYLNTIIKPLTEQIIHLKHYISDLNISKLDIQTLNSLMSNVNIKKIILNE